MSKLKEILVKKNRFLEDQKVQADQSRKGLRADNDRLLAEIDRRKRQVEVTKKVIDDLVREREILKANLSKTQGECTRLTSHLLLQKQQKTNIELEISRVAREAEDHRKETIKCIKDRDASIAEITLVQTQSNSLITEIKDKEMAIYELKKQMISAENKLKHQQNLYEGVQSDRNLHAKQLLESQGEIAEMKRKLRIMNFQINGYKDDINSKEAALSKTTIENHKLTKDTILIEDEIKTLKHQSMLAQTYIRSQLAEEAKLDLFVKDAELEKSRQENALLILINERDHLSTQLTRRNDELTSIYDKLKTQQSSLLRGEVYYKEKLKQIRQLRASVVEKRLYTSALLDETSGISDLKKTIMMLQNQITQEEMRIKALEEELENPINVHRWRKLEGSDPQTYDMLQMLHTLQKKLICKTKEEREKQQAIEIKEKLYLHLKSLLAKQIGPEALEQANEFEKTLKDKKMQLRHMDTELHMYQAQVQEYKYSIKNMDVEIADVKKRFLAMYTKKAREAEALKKEIANERKQVSTKHDMLPPLPGRDMAFSPTHSQVLASDVPAVNNQEYQALLESTIEEIHDNNDHFPEFQVEVTEELDHSDFKDDQLQELQAKEEIDQSVESGQVVEQADDQAISSEIN